MQRRLFDTPVAEAMAKMGSLAQCARIDRFAYEDGPMRGSRVLRLVSGGGLCVELHPDRALDAGALEVAGMPIAWLSPTRIGHPGLYDGSAPNFLRTFGGGFLTTCGLDHTGVRSEEEGQVFPQHGRIGATPAELTRCDVIDGELRVEGVVRQVAAMQEHFELRRTWRVPLGERRVLLCDTITNCTDRAQPHVVLYHCNFGWPLVDEHVQLQVDSSHVEPQTPDAEQSPFAQIDAPMPNRRECVYLHHLKPGRVQARLHNPRRGLRMAMAFDSDALPGLVQWKMLAKGVYALGLEPTNARMLGDRAALRQAERLPMLLPGQSVRYAIEFALEATPTDACV